MYATSGPKYDCDSVVNSPILIIYVTPVRQIFSRIGQIIETWSRTFSLILVILYVEVIVFIHYLEAIMSMFILFL